MAAKKKRLKKRLEAKKRAVRVRRNPIDNETQLRQAEKLFTDFRGDAPREVLKIDLPTPPRVLLTVGECIGIMYETVRDGRTEKYLHRFKKSARPLIASIPDGHQLYFVGGRYRFTDKGIVDDA